VSFPKQIVYIIGGKPFGEAINDMGGEHPIPTKGDIISVSGKQWKVVMVTTEQFSDRRIPVVRIAITDDLKLAIYP
jgi:hypothetical protein